MKTAIIITVINCLILLFLLVERATLKVDWCNDYILQDQKYEGLIYRMPHMIVGIGMRDDGVVVWREFQVERYAQYYAKMHEDLTPEEND